LRALARFSALAALALAVTGCGSDGKPGRGTTAAPPATTSTAAPTTGSTATAPPSARTTATTPPPTAGSSAGGGSEPIRIPATFTLRGGRLRPATVSVPAFLAVEVSVRNLDGVPRVVTVVADRPYRLSVPPGGRAVRMVPGQRHGTYPVVVTGGGRALLIAGGEPGP